MRRADVDDLVAIAFALGVTPNALLPVLPGRGRAARADPGSIRYRAGTGGMGAGRGTAGHRDTRRGILAGDGSYPDLDFSLSSPPYLADPRVALAASFPRLRDIARAVLGALAAGASGAQVRRITEICILALAEMSREEIAALAGKGKP